MAYSKAVKTKINKLEIENYEIKHELGKRITYLEDLLKETTAKYEQKADDSNKYELELKQQNNANIELQVEYTLLEENYDYLKEEIQKQEITHELNQMIHTLDDKNRQMTAKYEFAEDKANKNQFKLDNLQQEVNKLRDNNCKLKNHIINQIINS